MASATSSVTSSSPAQVLLFVFAIWKIALLLAAILSPGPGYDTSTSIALSLDNPEVDNQYGVLDRFTSARNRVVLKLMRWDALYFTASAQRGYLYEQEWAFGYGYSKIISFFSHFYSTSDLTVSKQAFTAILLSNTAHFLSVILLFHLTKAVYGNDRSNHKALLISVLHICAPAGMFLASPYGESVFSFLNIAGTLLYQHGISVSPLSGKRRYIDDTKLVLAGLFFGVASTVRSNGVFSGLFFAYDLLRIVPNMLAHIRSIQGLRYGFALVSGGLTVALGFAYPQYLAYKQYCTTEVDLLNGRPWCEARIPSIYVFVQNYYWDVGFLRYWKIANLPLFAFAFPVLSLMLWSGIEGLTGRLGRQSFSRAHSQRQSANGHVISEEKRTTETTFRRLALPQLALSILAVTNYHIQIITRLASGYALPYFWIAEVLDTVRSEQSRKYTLVRWMIGWMTMYAFIQGGLYASFLPPA